MVKLENELADWVSAGAEVDYRVTLGRMDDAGRPGIVSVDYTVRAPDGRIVHRRSPEFTNQAGQIFERVSSSEISELMGESN